ncbi:MAG TPA: GNAT family N-acetyltransferase [Kiritimatiellia bacterium]
MRPFAVADAKEVQRLAGDRLIAATTAAIPHPYEDGMAESWIATHAEQLEKDTGVHFAVTLAASGELIGACGLMVTRQHEHAELGYWIARARWGSGYCTEAAEAVVQYGFGELKLRRIFCHHMTKNAASGRVMQKLGMTHEGSLRKHFRKWDVFEDVEAYGLLASEWSARKVL